MATRLPLPARIYVASMLAAGTALLVIFSRQPPAGGRGVLAGLLVATVCAAAMKLRFPTTKNRSTISASFVIDFATLLLFGPDQAMWVSVASGISQSTVKAAHKNPLYRTLFNVTSLVVTVQATGLVYRALGGHFGEFTWPGDATPLAAAVTVYFLVNSGVVAAAVALSSDQQVLRVWHHNFLWGGPSYFVGAGVSVLLAEIVAHRMWALLPLVAVPAYLTYRAYRVFVGRLEEEHRHREVIESLNEGMAVLQNDGLVTLWNDALERIAGIPRRAVLGRPLWEAVPALARTALPGAVDAVGASGQAGTIEHFAFERQGATRVLQLRLFPFVAGVTIFWNDITDRAEAEAALKRSEERYALAAAGANDGLWDWDLESQEIYFSPRWKAMVGLPALSASASVDDWFGRVHPDDLSSLRAALDAHRAGETAHFEHEHRIRHEEGNYRWMLCRGAAVRVDGRAVRLAGSLTDVTERTTVQEQLRHAAVHDPLTRLPNRALFTELLAQVLERSRRHPDHLFAVLFLDIDRFKVVNDSLGHLIGDELLVTISRRIESCLRAGDVIARLGGDEFTILLNDLNEATRASVIAQRIHDLLRPPFTLGGQEVFVTVSIGIALSVSGYTLPEQIMRDADTAMYRAKALGKSRHEIFDASMHARAVDRLELESDLRRAIDRGDLVLNYQPIVSLPSGEWTGFEALLRWNRAGQDVPPVDFIALAEETGMIDVLGDWVLREACRQISSWRLLFPRVPVLGVTVNVSTRQLTRPDFVETVSQVVKGAGLHPGQLRLEITETTLMDNPERAAVVLGQLRALGVRVYLDDFGTGFSSLSYLHRFPVDTLKIDRSFIASLSESDSRPEPAIVQSIVALAKTLGTDIIAEGVETEEQIRELLRLGCNEAQGYFFSRPLPTATAEAVLAALDAKAAVSRAAVQSDAASHAQG